MKVTIDIKYFAIAIASLLIAFLTINGTIQNYIHFAGVANEIGFFAMAGTAGVLCLFASFEKEKK